MLTNPVACDLNDCGQIMARAGEGKNFLWHCGWLTAPSTDCMVSGQGVSGADWWTVSIDTTYVTVSITIKSLKVPLPPCLLEVSLDIPWFPASVKKASHGLALHQFHQLDCAYHILLSGAGTCMLCSALFHIRSFWETCSTRQFTLLQSIKADSKLKAVSISGYCTKYVWRALPILLSCFVLLGQWPDCCLDRGCSKLKAQTTFQISQDTFDMFQISITASREKERVEDWG